MVTNLASLMDQNTRVFTDSLQVLEGGTHVIQRIVSDVCKDRVEYKDEGGEINFVAYFQYYWACMVFTDFSRWLMSLSPPPPPVLVTPVENEPVVFGGP